MKLEIYDLIKAFEALDLMNGQYAESSNMVGNKIIKKVHIEPRIDDFEEKDGLHKQKVRANNDSNRNRR